VVPDWHLQSDGLWVIPERPELQADVDAEDYRHNPWHLFKEVGEGATVPVLGSIANTIFDAVGVRVTELPITPAKVLAALREKERTAR